MRSLLGILFLFFTYSLAGQCSIDVQITDVECVDGEGVWISFDVEGTGGTRWFLEEYSIGGPYDTDEIRTIGPIVPQAGQDSLTLFFIDAGVDSCSTTVVVALPPNCNVTTDPCFGFVASPSPEEDCGGEQIVRLDGGVGPYAFELSLGNQVVRADSAFVGEELVFQNLTPGTYLLAVIDSRNCTTDAIFRSGFGGNGLRVTIRQDGDLCTPTTQEVVLVADVTGGVAPYNYLWSDGSTTRSIFFVGNTDFYDVTVTDANGCGGFDFWNFDSIQNTINWFTPFVLPCDGGAVTISTGDSTDLLEYFWLTPAGDTLFGPSISVTETGNYQVFGQIPGAACIVTGVATVVGGEALPDDLGVLVTNEFINEPDTLCGNYYCLFVTGLEESNQNFVVDWFREDGSLVGRTRTPRALCLTESGVLTGQVYGSCDTATLTVVLADTSACGTLSGTVYLDQAGNCELDDGTDTPGPNVMVVATSVNNDLEYHTLTNADGEYYFDVPAGDYRVGPITDPFQPFGECPAPEVTVGSGAGATADLFLPVLFDCANMTTSVSLPFLRRCFENFAFVDYRNLGSITAENATLTVTLDDFFVGAIPNVSPTLVDGNTYTFDLGDVPPFTSGQINFRFTVSCEAELGQSHCLESSVTPDAPCNPKDSWNGAMVNITDAECDGQEVAFTVANVGDNSMSVPLSYVVVEDGVMMTPRPIQGDALDAGVSFKVRLPANGTTYQLITNQEPDAPASEEPTALSEGCGTDPRGNFTTGLANIVELGNGVPSEAVACRENVGAYDPNDKNGFPRGFGEQGNIQPGTRLEFAIRFQNTGTDTAFNVVIRDQIAPEFDLKTFRAESASHPFTVSIDTNRMVTFTFADIMLPDSNVNLAGSQGVVNYSIDHDPDLQRGQDLHNLAGIYFDFNEPIITNETNHRIAKSGLPVGTRAELARSVRMDVFPNPTDGLLRVNLPAEVSLDDVLTVIDVHGRTLQSTVYGRVGNGLDVSGLPVGYYYLVLRGANDGLAKGRTAFVRK